MTESRRENTAAASSISSLSSPLTWSIVIPAYAPGPNLDIAVESVLAALEGRTDFEVVVVDDASPTPIELSETPANVRVSRMEQNVGAVPNFNRALNHATGRFIHILHADDYVEPRFYEALEAGLAIDSVVAAACGVNRVDAGGALIETMKSEQATAGIWSDAFDRLAVANRLPAPSIVAKRSTYERVGDFDETLVHAADWDLWIRFADAGDFYYEPEPLAAYRVHEGQHTAAVAQSGANIDEAIAVIRRLPTRSSGADSKRLMRDALLYRSVYAWRTAKRSLAARDLKTAAVQLRCAARCAALGVVEAVPLPR